MTNKQYEHIGRAAMAEAALEAYSDTLDDLRRELATHLSNVLPADVANEWVKNCYGNTMAKWHNGLKFMDILRDVREADAKKEKRQ